MKSLSVNTLPKVALLILAFILYGNTLTYDYTLDDLIVIKENAFTKKGIAGIGQIFSYDSFTGFFGVEKKLVAGGRYRPLSIATFAVEHSLAGGLNPVLSHFINILLYALTGILIYLVLQKLFRPNGKKPWYLGIPFLTAVLFMVHPVHTEAVANIKGRDEILALLLPLTALWFTLTWTERKKPGFLLAANLFFFLGVLSKENAITFALIIPMTLYFFTSAPRRKTITAGLSLIFSALVFVFIRFLVLGYFNSGELPKELMNNPFLEATTGQRFGTILYTLGLYLKLLVFPHPLTHDYYPYHIPLVGFTDWRSIVPLILYLGMTVYAVTRFRSRDVIAYGILFYLSTLFIVSNLLFAVGTFMNERFIYMPSFGFALIVAYLVAEKLPRVVTPEKRYRQVAVAAMGLVLLLFTVRTVARNGAWKDNFTLFTTDVQVSANSVKCNVSAGGDLQKMAQAQTDPALQARYYERSVFHLEKAISIYPKTANGLLLYGNVLTMYKKDYKNAISQYLKILAFDPYNANATNNALRVLGSIDNASETGYKLTVLRQLYAINPENAGVNYSIGKLYGQFMGQPDSARIYLERAISLDPSDVAVYKDLGIVYSMGGDYARALDIFTRGLQIDPADPQLRQNIAVTKQIMSRQPVKQ